MKNIDNVIRAMYGRTVGATTGWKAGSDEYKAYDNSAETPQSVCRRMLTLVDAYEDDIVAAVVGIEMNQ